MRRNQQTPMRRSCASRLPCEASASIVGLLVRDGDRVFATYEARAVGGRRFRNTELFTLRGGQLIEVEVYFGWSIPHQAKPGGFVNQD